MRIQTIRDFCPVGNHDALKKSLKFARVQTFSLLETASLNSFPIWYWACVCIELIFRMCLIILRITFMHVIEHIICYFSRTEQKLLIAMQMFRVEVSKIIGYWACSSRYGCKKSMSKACFTLICVSHETKKHKRARTSVNAIR